MNSNNNNSEFDVISFSSSLEDSSFQQVENIDDSSCGYDYDDSDSNEDDEGEEEKSALVDKDAVIVKSTRRTKNQVEIIFPVQHEEGLQLEAPPFSASIQSTTKSFQLCAVAHREHASSSSSSSMASSSFVRVDVPSSFYTNMNNNSMKTTTTTDSCWSHIDDNDAYAVQSMTSTMMHTVQTAKSVTSAFDLVITADGSTRARCKACGFMNQKDGDEKQMVIGLCRGCCSVLVNNPCLEMDEVLAMTLQQKEDKDALIHRKKMSCMETLPFVRAQAFAAEVNSMMLRLQRDGACGNNHSSSTCTSTHLDINQQQEECCFACHPMKEMDLTFQASNFIECLERLRSEGFRLALGYVFSLKVDVANIDRDGLNCRLQVSTDPEVAFRLKNGLTALPTSEEEMVKEEEQNNNGEETNKHDKKEALLPVNVPLGQYNEDACVGWIVAVVSSLEDDYDWKTVGHANNNVEENPQKIEILNIVPNIITCNCLPLAYFDAKHRKDARITSLFQGLSDVCFDYFHTDWSLITVDEDEDECESGQDESATPSGTMARTNDENSRVVDILLDEKDGEALKKPMTETAPAGYCSSDDDTDSDKESTASYQETELFWQTELF